MAVKKAKETKVEEVVEVIPTVEVQEEILCDEAPVVEETVEVEEIVTEVEVEEAKPEVVVDTKSAEESNKAKPEGNVKIRMRVDHKCCIAMERYDLKAGKTYVVPENVKRILNNAGLLAPL